MGDEDLYVKAEKEFKSEERIESIFLKALTLANGDKELAKYEYIKLRVEDFKNLTNENKLEEKKINELEADEFSGFVISKLGGTLFQAQNFINYLLRNQSNNYDDTYSTHPSKKKRLLAIKKGYERGKQYNSPNTNYIKIGSLNTTYDYGNVKLGSSGNRYFYLTNYSNKELIIYSAKGFRGIIPQWSKNPIQPGEGTLIGINYVALNRFGGFNKTLTFATNQGEKHFIIKGRVLVE